MNTRSQLKSQGEDSTPMMVQYNSIKKDYPDSILFFRMGDFYEMFNDDAKTASRILEIALTSRNKNKSNPTPMCGIPHHSSNGYIAKLIKAGKSVAICEQVEDPKTTKGIVKRDVIKVVTPGTVMDESLLDPKNHHFLVSVFWDDDGFGLAYVDLSTGLFKVAEFLGSARETLLADELSRINAKEIVIPESRLPAEGQSFTWLTQVEASLRTRDDWVFSHKQAYGTLLAHFKTHSLEGFGCEENFRAICAGGALINYLRETQKSQVAHIRSLSTLNMSQCMQLDQTTVTSLELVQTSQGKRDGSLLDLLDLTLTPMGARQLKEWLLKPLIDKNAIQARLDMVKELKANLIFRNGVRDELKKVFDLERLLGRITLSGGNPRDLISLKSSLAVFPAILELLSEGRSPLIREYLVSWDNLQDVHDRISQTIEDAPPYNLKDGHVIKSGMHPELDRLKSIQKDGKQWIAQLETREKERIGIPQLKIGYNKIYGYYIEITKRNSDRIPPEYIRKQSLVNTERFISPELKEYEETLTGAEEKILDLEKEIFESVRQSVAEEGTRIQHMADTLSQVDVLFSFAEVAHRYDYCQPEISEDSELFIEGGRHPLIERLDPAVQFIPNDTLLDCDENQIMVITGPNMAGKSTYLRQVALISLMAQTGSFVPASAVRTGLVDRIFSRVGAQDHLIKGQSTFMVEMNETANILNNATSKSLIILDEIGRGTSTFDGISIAWAIVEYLQGPERIGAKTLFATHYHELTELAEIFKGVRNFNVQVKEWNNEILFLRKIVPGRADKSYGIQVARLAGLPPQVLNRASEVLFNLENNEFDESGVPKIVQGESHMERSDPLQMQLFRETPPPWPDSLLTLDPNSLSPKQALDFLYDLCDQIKNQQKL